MALPATRRRRHSSVRIVPAVLDRKTQPLSNNNLADPLFFEKIDSIRVLREAVRTGGNGVHKHFQSCRAAEVRQTANLETKGLLGSLVLAIAGLATARRTVR